MKLYPTDHLHDYTRKDRYFWVWILTINNHKTSTWKKEKKIPFLDLGIIELNHNLIKCQSNMRSVYKFIISVIRFNFSDNINYIYNKNSVHERIMEDIFLINIYMMKCLRFVLFRIGSMEMDPKTGIFLLYL